VGTMPLWQSATLQVPGCVQVAGGGAAANAPNAAAADAAAAGAAQPPPPPATPAPANGHAAPPAEPGAAHAQTQTDPVAGAGAGGARAGGAAGAPAAMPNGAPAAAGAAAPGAAAAAAGAAAAPGAVEGEVRDAGLPLGAASAAGAQGKLMACLLPLAPARKGACSKARDSVVRAMDAGCWRYLVRWQGASNQALHHGAQHSLHRTAGRHRGGRGRAGGRAAARRGRAPEPDVYTQPCGQLLARARARRHAAGHPPEGARKRRGARDAVRTGQVGFALAWA